MAQEVVLGEIKEFKDDGEVVITAPCLTSTEHCLGSIKS